MKPTKRELLLLEVLSALGGRATCQQIADKAGLEVNEVSKTLGQMYWDRLVWRAYSDVDTEDVYTIR